MENSFYNLFKRIIRECTYTNTYKMALAKSLVEIALESEVNSELVQISLEDIAKKNLKYYWNHTIFFDLIQGSNLLEIPKIIQEVKKLIEEYYKLTNTRKPERFERIEEVIKEKLQNQYNKCIKNIIKILKADVSWRFTYLNGINYSEIYRYEKGQNHITILRKDLETLKNNSDDLFDLINYKWGMILENYNNSPRINKKVRIIDEQEVKRNSLGRFKEYLDLENEERKCFLCGKHIEESDLSVDHVIPWSYLYSDDIWNLVYVHKSCNSSKNNIIPNEKEIRRLQERNVKLSKIMDKENKKGKIVDELKLAIEKDYVNKFYIGCKS